MYASQSSGAARRGGHDGAMRAAPPWLPTGRVRGAWRSVSDLLEDLIILAQFAFGRDYRANEIAKPRLVLASQLASRGSA